MTLSDHIVSGRIVPPLPSSLRYVCGCGLPGITRHSVEDGFIYRLPDGSVLSDEDELDRIRRLAIPPAYQDVWICPRPDGHLQATGRDARGRKQYRYHADWNAQRNVDKFSRLEAFGHALPRVRRRVRQDLASDDGRTLSERLVLATLVRLLDTTYVRVGNQTYARENRSYGLTTLRNRHVDLKGNQVVLSFRGKHGIRQEVRLNDPRVMRIIKRCKHLPGQELFQYEDGCMVRAIGSGDVNDYLSEATGERFTAKDFRTWHGTVLAFDIAYAAYKQQSASDEGFSVQTMLKAVAGRLGNTVGVCRKAYIHPNVMQIAQQVAEGREVDSLLEHVDGPAKTHPSELQVAEHRLLRFLALRQKGTQQGIGAVTKRKKVGVEIPVQMDSKQPREKRQRRRTLRSQRDD